MGTQGALVHTTQGGIRYAAYYDQGGPFEDFTGGEATNNNCTSSTWISSSVMILANGDDASKCDHYLGTDQNVDTDADMRFSIENQMKIILISNFSSASQQLVRITAARFRYI